MKKVIFLLLLVLTMISCKDNEPVIYTPLITVQELCITDNFSKNLPGAPSFDDFIDEEQSKTDSVYTTIYVENMDKLQSIKKKNYTTSTVIQPEDSFPYVLYTEYKYEYTILK